MGYRVEILGFKRKMFQQIIMFLTLKSNNVIATYTVLKIKI